MVGLLHKSWVTIGMIRQLKEAVVLERPKTDCSRSAAFGHPNIPPLKHAWWRTEQSPKKGKDLFRFVVSVVWRRLGPCASWYDHLNRYMAAGLRLASEHAPSGQTSRERPETAPGLHQRAHLIAPNIYLNPHRDDFGLQSQLRGKFATKCKLRKVSLQIHSWWLSCN